MSQPNSDEIEISIFGPGYGESILIHIGNGEWVVVDSCLNPHSKRPAALEYLEQIGVNTEAIKLIVATHWHDDHVRGLAEIVEKAPNATVVISDALKIDEFFKLVACYVENTSSMKASSGVEELSKILLSLKTNNKKPKFASSNKCILKRSADNTDKIRCEIIALSPSDASVLLSKMDISTQIPKLNAEKRRVASRNPNHSAVVLWVQIDDTVILLGADIENTKKDDTGWNGIIGSEERPTKKAEIFKVSHHGSQGADNENIWRKLLLDKPIALLTPWHNGADYLPKDRDIKRISKNVSALYMTAILEKRKNKYENKIERTLEESTVSRKKVNHGFGQVTLRFTSETGPQERQVELIGSATLMTYT